MEIENQPSLKIFSLNFVLGPQRSRLIPLPEMSFEFPFNITGKSITALLTGHSFMACTQILVCEQAIHSWRVLKSWCTGGGPQ